MGILQVIDEAVITSGGYERFFEENNQTYHHILDPETGYPADNGLVSVTIVSKDGTLADGLSTAIYVLGLSAAERLWQEHTELFQMILMTDEKEIYITDGISDSFSSEDYPVHIIEKQ